MELLIVSGISGSGKSKCLKALEDLGFYCIDNIMPQLISEVVAACASKPDLAKVALSVDIRGGAFFGGIYSALDKLTISDVKYTLLFLDASDAVLVNRYKETRREHPLAKSGRIIDGLAKERQILEQLRSKADIVIDTSSLSDVQLKQKISSIYNAARDPSAEITLVSFGFKRGIPTDSDFVFDVRFLPNPFHDPELRNSSGMASEVAAYIFKGGAAKDFCAGAAGMLKKILPRYKEDVKGAMIVSIGCTGGKHRSVAVAVKIGELLTKGGIKVSVTHRDMYME